MRRIIAISLAFILLLSNMGIIMTIHFCGGHAVNSRLATGMADLDCGMAGMDSDSNNIPKESPVFNSIPCCADHYQTLQTDNNYISGIVQVHLNADLIISPVQSFLNIANFPQVVKAHYNNHSPPYPEKNFQVLFQTFLI